MLKWKKYHKISVLYFDRNSFKVSNNWYGMRDGRDAVSRAGVKLLCLLVE